MIGGYNRELGDAIADFLLIKEKIIFRVQGEYWHTGIGAGARYYPERKFLGNGLHCGRSAGTRLEN